MDLAKTAAQLEGLAERLQHTAEHRDQRLGELMQVMVEADSQQVAAKLSASQSRPFLAAEPIGALADRHQPISLPTDFCVASVDGSHIDVDRHLPARCYLVNLGGCALTYGASPNAHLYSRPQLYSTDAELYLTTSGEDGNEEVPVQGPLLGLKRAVQEVEELAALAEGIPPGLPTLALVDGSLVLWGLAGRSFQGFVREELVQKGLMPALDRLMALNAIRPVAVAAYVSLPQSTEVVHTLRLLLCRNDADACRRSCSLFRSSQEPCNAANGFLDRDVFARHLQIGERSCLFATSSSISRDYYGPHGVYFYYLNVGEEIARIEVPEWVAKTSQLLDLSHALVLDQCRRGRGYPAAIMEAHEQAVIDGAARESFKAMLEDSLSRRGRPVYTSAKNVSKRVPWI